MSASLQTRIHLRLQSICKRQREFLGSILGIYLSSEFGNVTKAARHESALSQYLEAEREVLFSNDLRSRFQLSCYKQKPHSVRGENCRTSNGTYTERVGVNLLNMACGMVGQRSLLTARADCLFLARRRCRIKRELLVELGFWSDEQVLVLPVDHAQPLGLRNSELGFCDELDDD